MAFLGLVAGAGTQFEGVYLPPFTSIDEDDDPNASYEDIQLMRFEKRKCFGLALSDAVSLGPY